MCLLSLRYHHIQSILKKWEANVALSRRAFCGRLQRLVMCAIECVYTEGAIDHYQLGISVLNIFLLPQFEFSFVPEIYTFRCFFVNCFANPGRICPGTSAASAAHPLSINATPFFNASARDVPTLNTYAL